MGVVNCPVVVVKRMELREDGVALVALRRCIIIFRLGKYTTARVLLYEPIKYDRCVNTET